MAGQQLQASGRIWVMVSVNRYAPLKASSGLSHCPPRATGTQAAAAPAPSTVSSSRKIANPINKKMRLSLSGTPPAPPASVAGWRAVSH